MVSPQAVERALGRPAESARQTVKRRRYDLGAEARTEVTARVPQPLAAPGDIPLDPREIFVLSFVDGALDAAEISDIVGLPREKVDAILERLALFGCIQFEE